MGANFLAAAPGQRWLTVGKEVLSSNKQLEELSQLILCLTLLWHEFPKETRLVLHPCGREDRKAPCRSCVKLRETTKAQRQWFTGMKRQNPQISGQESQKLLRVFSSGSITQGESEHPPRPITHGMLISGLCV